MNYKRFLVSQIRKCLEKSSQENILPAVENEIGNDISLDLSQ